jgi:hypothetical protein
MTAWVSANEDLIASKIGGFLAGLINNLDKIVAVLKVVGTGLAIFYTMAAAVKVATVAMTAFNFVMAMNPIGLIVIGIAALITGLILLINNWDAVKARVLSFSDSAITAISAVLGPIGWLIGAATLVAKHWEPIAALFSRIAEGVSGAVGKLKGWFGFGESEEPGAAPAAPGVISPQERTARSIEERNLVTRSEVVIRDETGRAEPGESGLGPGLELLATGAF